MAEHILLHDLRAIKKISKSNPLHDQLLNEAAILKNLRNDCIPIIYDFYEDAHNSYIIEQYIEGQSLKELVKHWKVLEESMIINYTIQICKLIQYLHSMKHSILYLDLKPENIIIMNQEVKLIDFGASCSLDAVKTRQYSLGTKGYAAPELFYGKDSDRRADVYSIGALMFFMITGQTYEYHLQKKEQMMRHQRCTVELKKIIQKCLRYYPWLRYATVGSLKNNLLKLDHKWGKKLIRSSKSLSIAIAGTQNRIGVTHLAFLLAAYGRKIGWTGIYVEKNESNHCLELLQHVQNIREEKGVYWIRNIPMLPRGKELSEESSLLFPLTIYDFSCIYKEGNVQYKEEFMACDIKIIVCGAKEWELKDTECVLREHHHRNDMHYVFNYMNGKQYQECAKQMGNLLCHRMPFEPDPFCAKKNDIVEDFILELLGNEIIP